METRHLRGFQVLAEARATPVKVAAGYNKILRMCRRCVQKHEHIEVTWINLVTVNEKIVLLPQCLDLDCSGASGLRIQGEQVDGLGIAESYRDLKAMPE
jgi:hypothetical protein